MIQSRDCFPLIVIYVLIWQYIISLCCYLIMFTYKELDLIMEVVQRDGIEKRWDIKGDWLHLRVSYTWMTQVYLETYCHLYLRCASAIIFK